MEDREAHRIVFELANRLVCAGYGGFATSS
jgi:hypothetical protein